MIGFRWPALESISSDIFWESRSSRKASFSLFRCLRPLPPAVRSRWSLYKPKSFSLSVSLPLVMILCTALTGTRLGGSERSRDSTSRGTHLWETASRGASAFFFSFSVARRVLRGCSRTCQTDPPYRYRTWTRDTGLAVTRRRGREIRQRGIPISVLSEISTDVGEERRPPSLEGKKKYSDSLYTAGNAILVCTLTRWALLDRERYWQC